MSDWMHTIRPTMGWRDDSSTPMEHIALIIEPISTIMLPGVDPRKDQSAPYLMRDDVKAAMKMMIEGIEAWVDEIILLDPMRAKNGYTPATGEKAVKIRNLLGQITNTISNVSSILEYECKILKDTFCTLGLVFDCRRGGRQHAMRERILMYVSPFELGKPNFISLTDRDPHKMGFHRVVHDAFYNGETQEAAMHLYDMYSRMPDLVQMEVTSRAKSHNDYRKDEPEDILELGEVKDLRGYDDTKTSRIKKKGPHIKILNHVDVTMIPNKADE